MSKAQQVAQAIAFRRSIGLAKRRRRSLPRQVYPQAIEREYTKRIRRVLERFRVELQPLLEAAPEMLAQAARERGDSARADAGEGKRFRAAITAAQERLTRVISPNDVEELAEEFAKRTATAQRIQLNRQVKAALGADVFTTDASIPPLVDGFVAENVALIRSVPAQVATELEKLFTRSVADGRLWKDVAKDVQSVFAVGERRAKLIARDQVGKLYGQINAARQKELGATEFIWRTVKDERVRPEHVAIDGQKFKYADGGHPTEGLPGQPILCRCYAEPVFDSILAELDRL